VVLVLSAVAVVLVVVGPLLKHADNVTPESPTEVRYALAYSAGLFDLGTEANVPTWFAATLLVLLALALVVTAVAARARGGAAGPYLVLAVVALVLSVDEAAELHEQLNLLAGRLEEWLGPLPTFSWIVPGAALAAAAGTALLWLGRQLPGQLRRRLVISGTVFLLGALVVEGLSGSIVGATGYENPTYLALNALEEGLEKAGVLLALSAVLARLHVRLTADGLSVALAASPDDAQDAAEWVPYPTTAGGQLGRGGHAGPIASPRGSAESSTDVPRAVR